MPAKKAPIKITQAEAADRSPAYYYACGHQVSNTACPLCQPGEPPSPDNWQETYTPPGVPGTTDAVT